MDSSGRASVWVAARQDADAAARLLHDFNREYDEPTPPPGELAGRLRELLDGGDTAVLLAAVDGADGAVGVAVLRFRPSLWSRGQECYLAELYVRPDLRRLGTGRALLESSLQLARDRDADRIDLGTSEDDAAARHLYERLGFTNREGGPDGPIMYVYEREL